MKKSLILLVLVLLPFLKLEASEQTLYQMPGTQIVPIKDTNANKQYELYVKLPEGYSKNKDKKYPVIYFTDAVWHIELLSSATYFLMEDVILVGISWQKDVEKALKEERGESVSRARDYSISKSSNLERQAKYKLGQAKNHLTFIRNDVITYVESNYRTDAENRSYFGFSMGGLFGTYILMSQPDTFKNYILGSPSLWRDIPKLTKFAAKHKQLNANVLISYGSLEQKLSEHIKQFTSVLKDRNDNSLVLKQVVIDSAGHSDSFPLLGVRSIKWLASLQGDEDKS